jgi:purine-nucleoside phosphorylase
MKPLAPIHQANQAAVEILEIVPAPPHVAIVLGSGLGGLAECLQDPIVIPYTRIAHFPHSTVAGHHGNLLVGRMGQARAIVLQGRFHYYEGHDLYSVTFPVRVLQRLGVRTLILTAASGGIRPGLSPGSIVCVEDHLNLLCENPLRGPNDDRLGIRFPDMTNVYSERLRTIAREEAERLGMELASGVYACMPGPSYETPAEIRMLRTLGADVVGMSTVPEAIVARHAGMEVLTIALVANPAAGVSPNPITHEEVIEAGHNATPRLARLIEAIVQRIER